MRWHGEAYHDCISFKALNKCPLEIVIWGKNILCVFVSPHHLRRLLVCVLCSEVLQDLFVVAAVDVVAIDLKDDLARLKAHPRSLPACSVSTWEKRSKVTMWFFRGTVYN